MKIHIFLTWTWIRGEDSYAGGEVGKDVEEDDGDCRLIGEPDDWDGGGSRPGLPVIIIIMIIIW